MIGAMLVWEAGSSSNAVLHILEERVGKRIKSVEMTSASEVMGWEDPHTFVEDKLSRDWMLLPKEYST